VRALADGLHPVVGFDGERELAPVDRGQPGAGGDRQPFRCRRDMVHVEMGAEALVIIRQEGFHAIDGRTFHERDHRRAGEDRCAARTHGGRHAAGRDGSMCRAFEANAQFGKIRHDFAPLAAAMPAVPGCAPLLGSAPTHCKR